MVLLRLRVKKGEVSHKLLWPLPKVSIGALDLKDVLGQTVQFWEELRVYEFAFDCLHLKLGVPSLSSEQPLNGRGLELENLDRALRLFEHFRFNQLFIWEDHICLDLRQFW